MKIKTYLLLILLVLSTGFATASHIVGLRITYEYQAGGTYLFKLKLYRDCFGITAPTQCDLYFTSPSGCAPSFTATLSEDVGNSGFEVPFNSCAGVGTTTCNGGVVFAFEEYNYIGSVSVPPCSDWEVSYNLCCRNAAITNLIDPDFYSAQVITTFDNLNYPTNSSPQFNAVPLNYYCAGVPAVVDYSAYDVDGDSLTYEFTTIDGGSGGVPSIITFMPPLTYDQPLSTLVPTIFDPIGGQISFTPSAIQISVIGFKVSEYRNGVLIGSVRRDDEIVVVGGFVDPDTIAGRVYYDMNANNIFDGGDVPANAALVHMGPGNTYVNTASSGKYDFMTTAGSFTVSVPNPPPYTNIIPASYTINTAGTGLFYGNNDFALQFQTNMNDLEVEINNVVNAFPGNSFPVVVNYSNVGSVNQTNVDVVVTLDPMLQFVSAFPAPSSSAGNTYTWNFPTLNILSGGMITIQSIVDSTVQIGDIITCSANISSSVIDVTPANNFDSFDNIAGNSFDPNSKEVTPKGNISLAFVTSQQWLTYKINFQNLGTAPAQMIKIIDLLDIDLDLGSLDFISSSYPCTMTLTSPNHLEFNFWGINLPPASTNEAASHGFVEFRVKPKSTTPVNTYITNNGQIKFDFNAPIYTNLVANKVVTSTGLNSISMSNSSLEVFPNPAQDLLHIKLPSDVLANGELKIYNILGEVIFNKAISTSSDVVDISVSNFSTGLYLISLSGNGQSYLSKLVIE